MRAYLALLRGVNVGGRTVKMDRLKAAFEGMGLGCVRTYIQSGNVLFVPGEDEPKAPLNARIEAGLAEALGFEVSVILLAPGELGGVLAANPFSGRELSEGQRVYVTVFRDAPAGEAVATLKPDAKSADEFAVLGRAAYILCRGGYHETAYSNAFFEKKLKVRATTRNLEVMGKLLELAAKPPEGGTACFPSTT